MKVFELIQALQALDPQLEVLVSGYEGGYNNCCTVSGPATYVYNHNDKEAWYYGPHESLEYVKDYEYHNNQEKISTLETFEGVLIY